MPTLLIFDCDGTLIDSERLYNLAWADVLGRHGLPWTVDECAHRLMGRPLPDCYDIIETALGRKLPADFQNEVFAASDRWFAREGLQVIDGVREALARSKKSEYLPMPISSPA